MKTKESILTTTVELELIKRSSVWDIHNVNLFSIAKNKQANLYKDLIELKKQGYRLVSVLIGAKGWSQHSSSELLIYKGRPDIENALYNNAYEFDLSTY